MKKYTLIFFLFSTAGFLTGPRAACAPTHPYHPTAAHDFTQADTSRPLKIGDKVPDVILTSVINYPKPSARISDFKGKLLILDFWATWCSPCVAMIPKMDALQREFAGKMQFLEVAYQPEQEVRAFMERLAKQRQLDTGLPDVVGDTVLGKYFPHTYLPHYVWIGADGTVLAITGYEEVNSGTISRLLSGSAVRLPEKRDAVQLPYNGQEPLLAGGNGGNGRGLVYHSLLTAYIGGLPAGVTEYPPDPVRGLKITLRNVDLLWLYQTAYGEKKQFFPKNRIRLLTRDTTGITSGLSGQAYLNWMEQGNGYCYELVVPPRLAAEAYPIMQHDLSLLFPRYRVGIEKQRVECWVLVRTNRADSLRAAGGVMEVRSDAAGFRLTNAPLSTLVFQLNMIYMQLSPCPVIDETGYKGNVDLLLQADPSNVISMNAALKKYGLQFIKAKRKIDVIAVRDNDRPLNANQ